MRITAVLLAGGKSRRMGRDKATIEWRGRPLWQWQIEKLCVLRAEKIFLSTQSDVPWRPADVEIVLDTPPSRGPLSGLAAALVATETNHLLSLAVDMPFMTTEHLRHLRGLAADGMGVIPMIDGNAEPLAAVYPVESRAVFLEALEGDHYSLQSIVKKLVDLNLLRVMPVAGSTREFYKSINEPQDLD